MNRFSWYLLLLFTPFLVGCGGESNASKFQRMAKARAARNRAEAQTVSVAKADLATKPEITPEEPISGNVGTQTQPEPATPQSLSSQSPASQPADVAKAKPVRKPTPEPEYDEDDDYAPRTRRSGSATAAADEIASTILAFATNGTKVAYAGENDTVGVYDVDSKMLQRRIYTPSIKPSALAIGEQAKLIAVGGLAGNFKAFSLETTEGLDRFQEARIHRLDAQSARAAHDHPISAIAINEASQLIATGDGEGNIRIWSSSTAEEAMELRGGSDPYRQILSYQNGSKVFATTASELLYWNVASGRSNAVVLSKGWDHEPTVMVSGVGGKELAVGDVSGQIRTWNSSANGLVEEVFTAHQDAVASLGFSSSGDEMLSVSDRGEIISWSLPSGSETQSVGDSSSQTLRVSGDQIISATVASDAAMVAICDGSPVIDLVSNLLGKNAAVQNSSIAVEDAKVHRVAINPSGQSLAAITVAESDIASQLVVYGVSDGKEMAKQALPHDACELSYSDNGKVVAVTLVDHRVTVYSAETLEPLEVLGPIPGLQSTRLADDGFRVLLGISDGSESGQSIRPMPLSSLGKAKASEAEIVSLDFLDDGKFLLSSDQGGNISLWSITDFDQPIAAFRGPQTPILQSSVSADGRYVSAVYQGDENAVRVWDIDQAVKADSKIEPTLVITHQSVPTSADFTSDSRHLLVGDTDGMIRAWRVEENREIAQFLGHKGPVVDIASLPDANAFVSGGTDHSIRSWEFPIASAPDGKILKGAFSDSTNLANVPRPMSLAELSTSDPLEAARQALISGAQTSDIVDLMNAADDIKDRVKSAITSVMKIEADRGISSQELSQRRRTLARTQEQMHLSDRARNLSVFADGFSNLTFVGESNFKFGVDKNFRPVKLLFSNRFLYAARPSSRTPTKPKRGRYRNVKKVNEIADGKIDRNGNLLDDDGNIIKTPEQALNLDGDNGSLLSWDYRFSQLQAHAWSIDDLNVRQLLALPGGAGVFTVPQMVVFNQDGSSRRLGDAASWAVSTQPLPANQSVAVGSAGTIRNEDNILTVFDIDQLSEKTAKPTSQYRTYEGVVTAMAFAHNSPYIAFCVRERAVHRLFIADTETLQLRKLEEFNHSEPWLEAQKGNQGGAKVDPNAAQGINALAFAPDDSMLVAHGHYEKKLYKFSRWELKWDGNNLAEFQKSKKELVNKKGPFFETVGNEPIRFISRLLRDDERDLNDPYSATRRTGGPSPKLVVQTNEGFAVVSLNSGYPERIIPYLQTQYGRPEYTISSDGRWLLMGDDNGNAFIYDLLDGSTYSVTIDDDIEHLVSDTSAARPPLRDRPAHTGPVVGVALSEPDPGRDYPAFAATFGEENKVKVWELFPILDPDSGIRSRRWVPKIKRLDRPRKESRKR